MRGLFLFSVPFLIAGAIAVFPKQSAAQSGNLSSEFVVYSVYQALNMGNPGEESPLDYYVNMGGAHGVHKGTILEVRRKMPSYDLINKKLHKEVTFPIARLKVIHAENDVAIARLEKMNPDAETPAAVPKAVIVGDIVKLGK